MRELLATWAVHDLDHVAQVFAALAGSGDADVGPWKAYLGTSCVATIPPPFLAEGLQGAGDQRRHGFTVCMRSTTAWLGAAGTARWSRHSSSVATR